MTLTWSSFGAALLLSALAGLLAWLVLHPVRRRSPAGLLASLVLTGAAASTGALLGAIHEMLVSHWGAIIVLTAFSTAVTAVAAWAISRRLTREHAALRDTVAEIGAGRVPGTDGPRLTAEIARVRDELRTTAASLAATRERERALESARRELVSWVSHDLRTPLAGLRAMAEALEDGVVDDPSPYYKRITESVARLNGMVEDLFDLSRIQAGASARDHDPLLLDDLVSDGLAALEPLAAARDVRVVGAPGPPVRVLGSGPELDRAVTNLVANAIRHTPASGQVHVRIVVRGGSAVVEVSDECGGIAPEQLERVFDVGFRGESARTPDDESHAGAGLGLAIARGVVEAHAGTLEVENTEVGCRFRMILPLAGALESPVAPSR